jgi:hypothetical protein
MPYVTVGQENSATIDIYYQDLGADSQLEIISGGPHVINWTHADQINPMLLGFLHQK